MHEVMILYMRFRFYLEVLRVCLFSLFHIMQSCMVLQIKKKILLPDKKLLLYLD